jgi:hypothetical protein
MREILIKVKVEFENQLDKAINKEHVGGLCAVAFYLLDEVDFKKFRDYLVNDRKLQRVYYTWDGDKTDDKTVFNWRISEYKMRLIWLQFKIDKLN